MCVKLTKQGEKGREINIQRPHCARSLFLTKLSEADISASGIRKSRLGHLSTVTARSDETKK